jgi:hypothetical protein
VAARAGDSPNIEKRGHRGRRGSSASARPPG